MKDVQKQGNEWANLTRDLLANIFHDLMALFPHGHTGSVSMGKTHCSELKNRYEAQKDRTGSWYHLTFLSLLCCCCCFSILSLYCILWARLSW